MSVFICQVVLYVFDFIQELDEDLFVQDVVFLGVIGCYYCGIVWEGVQFY